MAWFASNWTQRDRWFLAEWWVPLSPVPRAPLRLRSRPPVRRPVLQAAQFPALSGLTAGNPPFSGQSLGVPLNRLTASRQQRDKRRFRQSDVIAITGPGKTAGTPPLSGQASVNPPNRVTGSRVQIQRRQNKQSPQIAPLFPQPTPFIGSQCPPRIDLRKWFAWKLRYRQSDVIGILGPNQTTGHPPLLGWVQKPRFAASDLRQFKRRFRRGDQLLVAPSGLPTIYQGRAESFGRSLDGAESWYVLLDGAEVFGFSRDGATSGQSL